MERLGIRGLLVGGALLGGLLVSGGQAALAQSDWCLSSPGYMNGCEENYFNMSHDPAPGTVIVTDQSQQPSRLASTPDVSQAGPQEDEQPGGQE
ncbi:MAG TPA: hypothetical protein VK066_21300 [Chloroflexota bacterium]|nr:hypothetical protein [Chloroflexota bacterium]